MRTHDTRSRSLSTAAAVVIVLALAGFSSGCSDSGSTASTETDAGPTAPVTETTVVDEPTTTLPAGAVAGLDDYDGDGVLDPTCRTQDFGAGLVLRIPCAINTSNSPEDGTRLVEGSLYRLPGSTDIDLTGISGSLVLARDTAGAKVVIVVFNTDGLFETGSAVVGSTDTLDGTIRLINTLYAGSSLQVRGHTDATGSPSANQSLSEERAGAVRDYLTAHDVNATTVTAVGLASTQPLTEEREPGGSPSDLGMRFNRRVEIVIRPPA
ncbi:MAG: OmpA-OmpF porin, family [Actinomycetota bacterium]|nr:OmpA-OmpF porin, family [Actinomycetota bacterium]